MIGVSLPFAQLVEGEGRGSDTFLENLAEKGVRSIELRAVHPEEDPENVASAARRILQHGMRFSVHTAPRSSESAVEDIFMPLARLSLDDTILVLHPVCTENARMMENLCAYARKNGLSVRFALENNRLLPDKTWGDSVQLVTDALQNADPALAGACFDMGHFAWYTRVWENAPVLPCKAFLERVIHTHIHAVYEKGNGYSTHFPLSVGFLPLAEYIASLGEGYAGALNLELEPPRFAHLLEGEQGISESICIMQAY